MAQNPSRLLPVQRAGTKLILSLRRQLRTAEAAESFPRDLQAFLDWQREKTPGVIIFQDLDISQNSFSSDQIELIFHLFTEARVSIERLRIFGTAALNDVACRSVAHWLANVSTKTAPLELHLSDCAITEIGFQLIIEAIAKNGSLPHKSLKAGAAGTPLFIRFENNFINEAAIQASVSDGVAMAFKKTSPAGPRGKEKCAILVADEHKRFRQKKGVPPPPEKAEAPKPVRPRSPPKAKHTQGQPTSEKKEKDAPPPQSPTKKDVGSPQQAVDNERTHQQLPSSEKREPPPWSGPPTRHAPPPGYGHAPPPGYGPPAAHVPPPMHGPPPGHWPAPGAVPGWGTGWVPHHAAWWYSRPPLHHHMVHPGWMPPPGPMHYPSATHPGWPAPPGWHPPPGHGHIPGYPPPLLPPGDLRGSSGKDAQTSMPEQPLALEDQKPEGDTHRKHRKHARSESHRKHRRHRRKERGASRSPALLALEDGDPDGHRKHRSHRSRRKERHGSKDSDRRTRSSSANRKRRRSTSRGRDREPEVLKTRKVGKDALLHNLLEAHNMLDTDSQLEEPKETRSQNPSPHRRELASEELKESQIQRSVQTDAEMVQDKERVRDESDTEAVEDGKNVRAENGDGELPEDWEKHWDEGFAMHYYWNAVTGESSWERPVESW